MNKQSKDGNISWTDYTWNPIKGLCPVGCWYCYGRAMYKRFKLKERLRFPLMNNGEFPKDPSRIFVCSTMEIFHPEIPSGWRDDIFNMIQHHYEHTFQILTKMPENIDRPMPDNVWLGVSIEESNDAAWRRIYYLKNRAKAKIKFVSIEPMFGMLFTSLIQNIFDLNWFIFGKLTGHGKKYDPDKRWIEPVVNYLRDYRKPTYLKNNLKEIWGEKLIQEFPE